MAAGGVWFSSQPLYSFLKNLSASYRPLSFLGQEEKDLQPQQKTLHVLFDHF